MGHHDFNATPVYRAVVAAEPAGSYEPPRIHNMPVPNQWRPIVVDQAAPPFQARPASGRYRPDTICDGWSTPHFTVRMASTRGDSHRHSGTPRQDAAALAVHTKSSILLFAVMDGVSSAPHAHVGAEHVGDSVLDTIWRMLDAGQPVDWRRVFETAATALVKHPRFGMREGETAADVERRLGTTVVAGTVQPTPAGPVATVARVGDSGAWLLHRGQYLPIFEAKGVGAATVNSAVAPMPRLPERVTAHEVTLSPGSVLIAATDGIGDPLGDGTGLVGQLFAAVLADPPPALGLAHAVDFSRETFDDDRTLVAVWPGR